MDNKRAALVVLNLIVLTIVHFDITKAEDESLPRWITDGTPNFTTSGNVVSSAKPGYYGSPANAYWKESPEGVKSGSHYWEFTILEGDDYFFGLSDSEKFQKGWYTDGLFYGGNLADGSALLVGNFGPSPKAGDVVGMLVKFEDAKIKVYFYINGRPLGLAYDLDENVLNGAFPTVQFHGTGSVSIKKISQLPINTDREPETFESFEGNWELVSLKKDGENQDIPTSATLFIKLSNDNDEYYSYDENIMEGATQTYVVGALVMNSIWAKWIFSEDNGSWSAFPGFSTLVGGPDDVMQFEFEISNLIFSVNNVEATKEELLLTSKSKSGSTTMESVWKRYTPSVGIVTKNPFDRS